jgi:hypothetical protein
MFWKVTFLWSVPVSALYAAYIKKNYKSNFVRTWKSERNIFDDFEYFDAEHLSVWWRELSALPCGKKSKPVFRRHDFDSTVLPHVNGSQAWMAIQIRVTYVHSKLVSDIQKFTAVLWDEAPCEVVTSFKSAERGCFRRSLVRSQMVSLEFFIDINSSDRTMALGPTQLLTEMSTRNIFWG